MNIQEVDAMTVQQAIEYSLDKLVKQGKRCVNDRGCAYGNNEGNHCAIGWLLDANNRDLMRFKGSASNISDAHTDFVPLLIRNKTTVFNYFQHFHDTLYKVEREGSMHDLLDSGIDTSHPNFQAWIDLGEQQQPPQ
jgi:hypothetical protein